MGRVLADQLHGRLDLVLVARLRHPQDPRRTLGAVNEGGQVHLLADARQAGVSEGGLEREAHCRLTRLRQLRDHYTPERGPLSAMGRIAIVVDDGSASGATLASALEMVRRQRPARLVAAVGVAAPATVERLLEFADEAVCLLSPAAVPAVADFYRDFPRVDDDQVLEALQEGNRR